MTINALDKVLESLEHAHNYPKGTYGIRILEHSEKALRSQLDSRTEHLFEAETEANVHFLERSWHGQGYHQADVRTSLAMKMHLGGPAQAKMQRDPSQRLMFIHAKDSRSPLQITRLMLLQILAYHQVMPNFLNFVLPFGRQHYVRDFHSSGFRSNSHMTTAFPALQVPELGRSGLQIEMCYSLKSVERSSNDLQPWAMRQCSVYHAYDMQKDRMVWIVVKANRLMKKAIAQCLEQEAASPCGLSGTGAPTLACALAVHKTLASWAGENWQWCISDMEVEVQNKTRRAVFVPLESTVAGSAPKLGPSDSRYRPRRTSRSWTMQGLRQQVRRSSTMLSWLTGEATLSEDNGDELETVASETSGPEEPHAIDDFSFNDLQNVQYFEERANGALAVLKSNSNVLRDLDREYIAAVNASSRNDTKITQSIADIEDFSRAIHEVIKDLAMQESRVESLLRLLADRKALIQGILQFRSVQASTRLALRAQESTEKMEYMTRDMHAIARKTKTETVHMRIITIVTMFFLPGTFISTLMSTPIVNFDNASDASGFSLRNIGVGALELYLVISLPLLFITLLTWWGVNSWEQRKDRSEKVKQAELGGPGDHQA